MDNNQPMRYAIYARYSSDLQRQTSIADQLRKCHEFAQSQGWVPVKDCIYTDEAISGVSTERPGLQRMLQAALSMHRSFDVVLIDDTSRISRSLRDLVPKCYPENAKTRALHWPSGLEPLTLHQGAGDQQAGRSATAEERVANRRAAGTADRHGQSVASGSGKTSHLAKALWRPAARLAQPLRFERKSADRVSEVWLVRREFGNCHRSPPPTRDVRMPAALLSGSLR